MRGRHATPLERRRWGAAVFRQAALWTIVLNAAGCAYSYVDSNNVRHIVGIVDVALPAAPAESVGPSVVSVTSLGVHVYSGTSNGGGVVLGYGKETVLTMPNNACVDLGAPGVCAAATASSEQAPDGKGSR